jgi:hypothetical protein
MAKRCAPSYWSKQIKPILVLLALLFCFSRMQAQNVEGQIIAAEYGRFTVPGQTTGSFQFPSATCQVSGGGKNFAAFATGRPIKIVDANPAHTEIVTPSSVYITACSVNMATTYTHVPPYALTSGTGGLQEALDNGMNKNGGPNTIILNQDWYGLVAPGNPATVIATVHGNATLGLVDITTTPYSTYAWNGTAYVLQATGGGTTTPATPLVLKGGGSANSVVAATPNVDYLTPTYWSALTGCATAGYVYSPQSNTCVAAGAGGGGVTQATQYQLGQYNAPGTGIVGSNVTVDATGNNLTVPAAAHAVNVIPSNTPVIDARSYGAVADGTTDNTTAINNAIAAGLSSNQCVFFPPGVYAHASPITVTMTSGSNQICLEGKNRNSRFKYTGSSTTSAWTFLGLGSPNYRTKFVLRHLQFDANGLAQYAVNLQRSVKGELDNLEARNSTIGGFWCQGCVSDNWIAPVVSSNLELYTTQPQYGLILDAFSSGSSGGETVTDMAMEGVSIAGLWMESVLTSHISGGTSEGNATGILCSSSCDYNHFDMIDMEANPSGDLSVAGLQNVFTADLAIDSNAFNNLARGNTVVGGDYGAITVASGAYGNTFEALTTTAAIADSGRSTVSRNLYHLSAAAFWPDINPVNTTFNGTALFNQQVTESLLPIWNFPGWQGPFIARQQPENYLLQSGNGTVSPWTYLQSGAGIVPTVTASGATDPLGGTGDVTEVQLSLNGGVTSSDRSTLEQTVTSLSNPHNSRQCIYIKANSGTPEVLLGNLLSGNGLAIVTTSSWQGPLCTTSISYAGTSDQWILGLIGGTVFSNTADVLIYGAQEALNNGSYIATTTAPIDFTGYLPLGASSAGFTLGTQAITSTSNTTLANTVIPNCATGGTGTQVCDAAGAWVTYAPLASPAFTGTPTAPTQAITTNNTDLATTAAVTTALAGYATTTSLSSYAPLASPALTGTPTAPTQAVSTNNTDLATTAAVTTALTSYATTSALASYAPLASPALTGTPTAPTNAISTNNTDLATTAAVTTALSSYAPLASPALTGTPTAPTQAISTNNTDIATTAAVTSALPTLPLSQANGGFGAAVTEANCLAGSLPMPCRAGHVAPTLYSGTSSTGITTIATPATAGQFRICGFLDVTVAATAGTAELYKSYTSDGHVQAGSVIGGTQAGAVTTSIVATSAWNSSQGCESMYVDASTNIQAELFLGSVTGTPTFRYSFTLERLQ